MYVCLVAVATQGISHVTTQLVLLREMLTVYSGNELVIGMLLGCWLLLTGLGAGAGRWSTLTSDPAGLLAGAGLGVAVLPVVTVAALRSLRNSVFTPGAEIGWGETLASSLVLLAPYCLLTGFSITLAATVLGRTTAHMSRIGLVYVADGAGDVAGGAAFGLLLSQIGNHFVTLTGVGVVVALGSGLLASVSGRRGLGFASLVTAVSLGAVGAALDLDALTLERLYPGRTLLAHRSSPYGDLLVTESSGQIDWLQNGLPLASSGDLERAEEVAHFPMAQRPEARRVLLVGGTLSGTSEQLLAYPEVQVDCVELDPNVLDLRRRFVGPDFKGRLRFIESDARTYIRETTRRYHVLIVDLPDPSTAQLNRYYTDEFFQQVKRRLEPGGVVSLSIGTYANFVSTELGRLLGIVRSTLTRSFSTVLFVPTERVTVLASNGPLTLEIAPRLRARGIRTQWVTEPMLNATLSADRIRDLQGAAGARAPVNTDFRPFLQSATLEHWRGRFDISPAAWLAGLAGVALAVMLALGRTAFAIGVVGFAAAGLEVILLLGLQITRGAVYGAAALVVTAYMLGSTLGAAAANRREHGVPSRALGVALLALGAFSFACPPVLAWLGRFPSGGIVAHSIFPAAAIVLGAIAGSAFPFAARAEFRGIAPTAARLWAADLVGASLGALLIGTLLLPGIGVSATSASVGAVCVAGAALMGLVPRVPSAKHRSKPEVYHDGTRI